MNGYSIKNLLEDDKLFEVVKDELKRTNRDHQPLRLDCTIQELDQEVK